jgi:K+-sensing histidine kinase KdpD
MEGARLSLSGSAALEGVWKLIARPFFNPKSGRFAGYRGFAQRSIPDKQPVVGKLELLGHEMQPDSVRQLVHELRTPLNAIRGFAEMIEGEFLGQVARVHREQATQIVVESDRLLHVFEDLDIASQLAGGRYVAGPDQSSDLIRLVKDAAVAQTRLTTSRGAALQVVLPDMEVKVEQDQATIRRLLDRMLTVVIACASTNEKIRLSVVPTRDYVKIVATKPSRLRNASLRTLFDSVSVGGEPSLPDLPLGVGFVFRLIDQLSRQCGAALEISGSEIVLNLARESISARESREPR